MKYYIAGPMSGIPQFNYPLFDKVGAALIKAGHKTYNPSEMDDDETRAEAMASETGILAGGTCNGESWGDFLSRDVKLIADSDINAICLLPGWEKSRGARLEAFVAISLNYPAFEWIVDRPVKVQKDWILERIKYGMMNPLSNEEKRYGG